MRRRVLRIQSSTQQPFFVKESLQLGLCTYLVCEEIFRLDRMLMAEGSGSLCLHNQLTISRKFATSFGRFSVLLEVLEIAKGAPSRLSLLRHLDTIRVIQT